MGELRSALATPQGKSRYVRRLFGTIADRYDFITVVLSCGMDRGWKRRLTRMAGEVSGARHLDLACGTGDIAVGLAARGARTVGLDITPRMLEIAAKRSRRRGVRLMLVAGDMPALPFADSSFELVTAGYGFRNAPVLEAAVGEANRVLAPGGQLISLDFNRPENRILRAVYLVYLTIVGSLFGLLLHRDPDTYRYIAESIRRYPGADGLVRILRGVGFEQVGWVKLLGGLMSIHHARRPIDEAHTAPSDPPCPGRRAEDPQAVTAGSRSM